VETVASEIMNRNFVMVEQSFTIEQIRFLMKVNSVETIPIVDAQRNLIDLVTASSLESDSSGHKNPVLILAGGQGKRLRPLTRHVPKPMLPIRGQPMIERLIQNLVSCHFTDIHVSTNYLGHVIEEHLQDGRRFGCKITYLHEETELGTAGPMRFLKDAIAEPLLVVNGDLLTAVNFEACLDFHQRHGFGVTVGVIPHRVEVPYGVINLGEGGVISGIKEKPVLTFPVNAGLYVVEPRLLDLIEPGQFCPMNEFIEAAIGSGGRVGAFPVHEFWMDVGLPEQYFSAQSQASIGPEKTA
jgi:NDP-sugar pyrophosphorylase family protein